MRKHVTEEASTEKCSSNFCLVARDGPRDAATSKMECFVIIANGSKPLNIITKHSILDVVAALDPSLVAFIKLI